jgi:hypothetical protein
MRVEVTFHDGRVDVVNPGPVIAHGTLLMGYRDVANQLCTAEADGPHNVAELGGLVRYGAMLAGNLWDVAARKWLTYAPSERVGARATPGDDAR